jgi:hypothetical protein
VALSAFEPRASVDGDFYADTLKAYLAAQRSFSQLSLYAGAGLSRVETRSGGPRADLRTFRRSRPTPV